MNTPTPELLQLARRRAGLTKAEAARRANVSRQSITKWEAGRCAVSADKLTALATAYGVSEAELLGATATPATTTEEAYWRGRYESAMDILRALSSSMAQALGEIPAGRRHTR